MRAILSILILVFLLTPIVQLKAENSSTPNNELQSFYNRLDELKSLAKAAASSKISKDCLEDINEYLTYKINNVEKDLLQLTIISENFLILQNAKEKENSEICEIWNAVNVFKKNEFKLQDTQRNISWYLSKTDALKYISIFCYDEATSQKKIGDKFKAFTTDLESFIQKLDKTQSELSNWLKGKDCKTDEDCPKLLDVIVGQNENLLKDFSKSIENDNSMLKSLQLQIISEEITPCEIQSQIEAIKRSSNATIAKINSQSKNYMVDAAELLEENYCFDYYVSSKYNLSPYKQRYVDLQNTFKRQNLFNIENWLGQNPCIVKTPEDLCTEQIGKIIKEHLLKKTVLENEIKSFNDAIVGLRIKITREDANACDVVPLQDGLRKQKEELSSKVSSISADLEKEKAALLAESTCENDDEFNNKINALGYNNSQSELESLLAAENDDWVFNEAWIGKFPCKTEAEKEEENVCMAAINNLNSMVNDHFGKSADDAFKDLNNQLININAIIDKGVKHSCEDPELMDRYKQVLHSIPELKDQSFREIVNENFTILSNNINEEIIEITGKKCDELHPTEYFLAITEYNTFKKNYRDNAKITEDLLTTVQYWINEHPCVEEPTDDREPTDCPSERYVKDDAGNCKCKEPEYTADQKGNCLTDAEILGQANADLSDSEEVDCNEASEAYVEIANDFKSDIKKISNNFDAHHIRAVTYMNGIINDPCKNEALVISMAEVRDHLGMLNRIKYDLDLSVFGVLGTGMGCADEVNDYMSRINPLLTYISDANYTWDALYERWTEFNCRDEDITSIATEFVNDPSRNPSAEATGGAGRDYGDPATNVDDPEEEEEQNVTMYHAVRLSGSGYRKYYANSAELIEGSQVIIFTVYPSENIDDKLQESVISLLATSELACDGPPSLCPCAPWPTIWSGTPSYSKLDKSTEIATLINTYGCDNNSYHGQGGYTCLNWTYTDITHAEVNCN